MGRFNKKIKPNVVKNLAGAKSYKEDKEFELATILCTSTQNDQFYRTASDTEKRIKDLLAEVNPLFAAKASIYARNEIGLRTITHIASESVIARARGEKWLKHYLLQIMRRPDDMSEILSYWQSQHGRRPIPNSLKRAMRMRIAKMDEHTMSKYKMDGKATKLVDLVNICHPDMISKEAISKLMTGKLEASNTWETKLTQAGQTAKTETEKAELKEEAWETLLTEGKLGYLALLRNLRNIAEQAKPEVLQVALNELTNPGKILKSLTLPFQYLAAIEAISDMRINPHRNKILDALKEAVELSVDNIPVMDGNTILCVDCSGSMAQGKVSGGDIAVRSVAALFAAAYARKNPSTLLITFDTEAKIAQFSTKDSVVTNANALGKLMNGGGTDFRCVFSLLKEINHHVKGLAKFSRMLWLSDMQGWVGGNNTLQTDLKEFENINGPLSTFSFDLCGFGTTMFPYDRVYALGGISPKIFDTLKLFEEDKNAFVNKIKAIYIEGEA